MKALKHEWGYAKSKELLDLAIDKIPRQRAINLGPLAHIEKYGRSESKKREVKSLYMKYHIKSLLEERELLIDLIYRTKKPMVLLPEGKFVHHKAADVPTGFLSTKPFPMLSKNSEPLNNYERQGYSSDNSSLAGFLHSRCLPTLPENPERCATDNLEQTDSLTHYNSYKNNDFKNPKSYIRNEFQEKSNYDSRLNHSPQPLVQPTSLTHYELYNNNYCGSSTIQRNGLQLSDSQINQGPNDSFLGIEGANLWDFLDNSAFDQFQLWN
ncbi:hypothetical protein BS50DRAFT_591278 [Corynespora cassiicola Philippines]|uniref:Uncharacterized protein n=1 Tax=Corynespora cassiicola Philippines TaxID=1448308 RepID=A0A2T2NCG0_CORCC|nr:hypothetical protein BS50DRAFT_591278 [Corynespora cassiicola Philippines]